MFVNEMYLHLSTANNLLLLVLLCYVLYDCFLGFLIYAASIQAQAQARTSNPEGGNSPAPWNPNY